MSPNIRQAELERHWPPATWPAPMYRAHIDLPYGALAPRQWTAFSSWLQEARSVLLAPFLGDDAFYRIATVAADGRTASRKFSLSSLDAAVSRLAAGTVVALDLVSYSPSLTLHRIGDNAHEVASCSVRIQSAWNFPENFPEKSMSFTAIPEVYPQGVMPPESQEAMLRLVSEISVQAHATTASITLDRVPLPYEAAILRHWTVGTVESASYLRGYYWANLLTEGHLDKLQLADLYDNPVWRVEDCSTQSYKAVMVRLVEPLHDHSSESLCALRQVLAGALPAGDQPESEYVGPTLRLCRSKDQSAPRGGSAMSPNISQAELERRWPSATWPAQMYRAHIDLPHGALGPSQWTAISSWLQEARSVLLAPFLGDDAYYRIATVAADGRTASRKFSLSSLDAAVSRLAAGAVVALDLVSYSPSLTLHRIGYNAYNVAECSVRIQSPWNFPDANSVSFTAGPEVYPQGVMPPESQEAMLRLVSEISVQAHATTASITHDRTPLAYEGAILRHEALGALESASYLRGYYWANLLTEGHLDKLQLADLHDNPAWRIEDCSTPSYKAVMVRLVEPLHDHSTESLCALRKVLAGALPAGAQPESEYVGPTLRLCR